MKTQNAVLVKMSDMHSGSDRALFPDWAVDRIPTAGDEKPVSMLPSARQKKIFAHFKQCAEKTKEVCKGKKMVVVHNGDAIEGIHHNNIQIMSANMDDHVNIHTELMEYFIKHSGFSRKNGDELHYVSGTESHTSWKEGLIVKHFDHIEAKYHDELKYKINGREVWFTHHGSGAGDGATEGNGYRNWLGRIYWNNIKRGLKQPDLVVTAHVHKPIYTSFVQDYHTIHGVILPSWQMKTRYAYRAAPFQRNDIGLSLTEITAGGDIRIMPPLVMEM